MSHRMYDPGPRMPLGNDTQVGTRPFSVETGRCYKITAIFPYINGVKGLEHHDLSTICRKFGGYTAWSAQGGWADDTGNQHVEYNQTIYVTCKYTQSDRMMDIVRHFQNLGKLRGEEWTHIEVSVINSFFTNTNPK